MIDIHAFTSPKKESPSEMVEVTIDLRDGDERAIPQELWAPHRLRVTRICRTMGNRPLFANCGIMDHIIPARCSDDRRVSVCDLGLTCRRADRKCRSLGHHRQLPSRDGTQAAELRVFHPRPKTSVCQSYSAGKNRATRCA